MQACKYAALTWPWTKILDDVIHCLLECVISGLSPSLSLSRFQGKTQALNLLWRRGKTSCLTYFSLSSTMTVSVAKSGPQAEQNRIEQLLLHIIVKKVSFMVGIFQFLIKLLVCIFAHV